LGSIEKRPRKRRDGTGYNVWRARTRVGGRQVSRTFRRKVDAEGWLVQLEADKGTGTAADPRKGRTRYGRWLDEWEAARARTLRPSTLVRDETYLRVHVRRRWDEVPLGMIARAEVIAWVGALSDQGLAPATVRKVYQLFAASLEGAVTARYIGLSPCRDVPLPRDEPTAPRFLTPAEVARLAGTIDPRYRALVFVLAYGGLRIGEAAGLERDDLADGQLRVRRGVSWVRGHPIVAEPKTAAGRRSIALPSFVWDELADHLERHAGPVLVFPAPGGGYLQPSTWRRRTFARATDAAGLEGLRVHDLRHTAVSLWIAAGADPKRVAVRAGHASVAFTLQRYGHLYPDAEGELMGALDTFGRSVGQGGEVVPIRAGRR
jgi:integrase